MTRDELVKLRQDLLLGIPPYDKGIMGELVRKSGAPGLHERRQMGNYDANAVGILVAMEACLVLCQHVLDNMPRGADE